MGRVAEEHGWLMRRQAGSHRMYTKPGERSTLSIPDHRAVDEGLLRDLIRRMGLTVEEFLSIARK
ncbi:MAG: type II toxin-antitoxin system HicA family toxin [Dehalococcoidia bacterium]